MAVDSDFCQRLIHAMPTGQRWPATDPRVPALAGDWLGPRDWWCSGPVPSGPRVAIVSSRFPRIIDPHGPWLRALRAALAWVRSRDAVLVSARGTAGHELVVRGAVRHGIKVICLHCCDAGSRAAQSEIARSMSSSDQREPAGRVTHVWVLPALDTLSMKTGLDPELRSIPERDRAAFAWADQVIVLGLRARGNLHWLLRHLLARRHSGVLLANSPGLQARRARDELVQKGATLWPVPSEAEPVPSPATAVQLRQPWPIPAAEDGTFLTHTTRACPGPWPDQSRDDYLDSLLDARPDADHSALAVLRRILSERRLIASGRAIRRGFRVVSFTAVPLAELPRLRVFRSHRGRWDFEPYGLCIRRSWLESRDAQAVIYTGNSDWSRLDDADRPFYQYERQLDSTAPSPDARRTPIDWSLEREWRHVGDLDLRDLPRDDAIVFVPTAAEAEILLESSAWPVTVLEHAAK